MAKRQLTALGGAIFAGLFTKGVEQAGFKILGHLEHGDYGVKTARLNYPDIDIRVGLHNWRPHDFTGKVDLMYTNPPCAVWSSMRSKAGQHHWSTDKRLDCVTTLVDAGLIIRPKAWCWESVTNAWRHGRDFVLEVAKRWNREGYNVTILLQDNQYLGVPQRRKRMFLIAHQYPLAWPPLTKPVTVEQALKKAPKLRAPTVAPGELTPHWHELWKRSATHRGRLREAHLLLEDDDLKRVGAKGAPLAVTQRLRHDEPAPVMLASFTRLHPHEPRMLTWGEWLSLCGLPRDWKTAERGFDGATRELARAVMPPVGRWLATAVKDGLGSRRDTRHVSTRVVDMLDPERIDEELLWREPLTKPTSITVYGWPHKAPDTPPPRVRRHDRADHVPGYRARPGSGLRIRELLVAGKTTGEILATIHAEFPQSKATGADVSWNRRKLRLNGGQP